MLGLDASHNAGVAQNAALSQQQLQNQYGTQAAGQYGTLSAQGAGQASTYQNNILPLLNQYASTAGVGIGLQGQTTATSNAGTLRQPTTPGQDTNNQSESNPYNLDQYQQQQLNQSLASVQNAQKSATSSAVEALAARGITDPRYTQLATEQIQEHFAGIQAQTQTAFYEQVKQDKLAALQQLIAGTQNIGQTGIAQQEAAGSGYLGLSSGAQAASNADQQTAFNQQQLANQQISGVLNLIGFASGGGFSGGGGGSTESDGVTLASPSNPIPITG